MKPFSATRKNGRDQVVICGAYGRGNAGDDAILLAILRELRSINPDLSCQVFSRNPIDTRRTYRVNAFYTFNFWKAVHCFKQAKFFINGGGSLMQDVTSYRSLWFYLWTLAAAKRHGRPVIMYGCGIGPIYSKRNRARTTKVMNRYVDAITLRDPDSMKELEVLGVTKPKLPSPQTPPSACPLPLRMWWTAFWTAWAFRSMATTSVLSSVLGPALRRRPKSLPQQPIMPMRPMAIPPSSSPSNLVWTYPRPASHPADARPPLSLHRGLYRSPDHWNPLAYEGGGLDASARADLCRRQGVPLVGIVYDQKVCSFLSYIGQDLYEDLNKLSEEKLKVLIDGAISRGKNPRLLSESVEKLRRMDQINRELLEQYAAPQV